MPVKWLREKNCIDCGKKYLPTGVCQRFCVKCGKKHRVRYQREHGKSERGKASRRKHDRSEKGKEKYKRYRNTDEYRKYGRDRYRKTPKHIRRARYYVKNAVRDGRLKRLDCCEECGKKEWGKNRRMIESHHYLGYKSEHWLDVKWLCTDCHKQADKKEVV